MHHPRTEPTLEQRLIGVMRFWQPFRRRAGAHPHHSIITELNANRALNLNGGPSPGLWCRGADWREHFMKPGWAARNAIIVVPRDSK